MKRFLLILVATVMFAASADAQLGRRYMSEASDYFDYHHITSATTDTITATSGYKYGDGILVGIVYNTAVANDTLIVKEGASTIATIIIGGTAPGYPFTVPYSIALSTDSVITVQQKKTSDVGIIYRLTKP